MAEMHELKVDWDMATVTYDSLPMPQGSWPHAGVPCSATPCVTQADMDALYGPTVNDLPGGKGPHTVDVTSSIRDWLSGTPNYGTPHTTAHLHPGAGPPLALLTRDGARLP